MATNRFINVNGGEWNTAANWLLDDDGTTARVPLATDDVVITASLNAGQTITITTTAASAKSIDFSTAGNAFSLSGTVTQLLSVSGSATLKAGMTWSPDYNTYFNISDTGNLDTNGVKINSRVRCNASGKTVTLINNNLAAFNLSVYGGATLVTNNLNITLDQTFGDGTVTGNATLTLGSSTINCTNVNFAAATLTVSDNTATINVTSTADITSHLGGVAWGTGGDTSFVYVMTVAKSVTINGANTIGSLNVSWTSIGHQSDQLMLGADQTISGTLTVTGFATFAHPLVRSAIVGTQRTITAGTVTITNSVDFQDIRGAGAGDWDLSGQASGDCGGNFVDSPKLRAATTYYGVGPTGNFSYNRWSVADDTSADGTAVFPLPQDIAKFTNTGVTATAVVTVDMIRCCAIDTEGLTDAMTLVLSAGQYYGDLILTGTNLTVTSTGVTLTIDPRVRYENYGGVADTLDINSSIAIGSGSVAVGKYEGQVGTVRLLTNNLTHTGTFTLAYGTFDLNGLTLSTGIFSSSNANTRVLQDTPGGGKIITTGLTGTVFDMSTVTGLTVSNAPAIQIGSGAATLTGDVTFAGGGKTFGNFTVSKHAGNFSCLVTGTNVFGIITLETPNVTYQYAFLKLPAGVITTCTGFVSIGTATYNNILTSSTAATHTLSAAVGSANPVAYTNVSYSIAQGGAVWTFGYGSTNGGNNTGWVTNKIF